MGVSAYSHFHGKPHERQRIALQCTAMHAHCNALQRTSMRCSALQCAAAQCNVLQCAAAHCNVLQCAATCCNVLQRTATHGDALQHTATHCNALQCTATHCNALQRTATHCNTLQHTAIHCNTLHLTAIVATGKTGVTADRITLYRRVILKIELELNNLNSILSRSAVTPVFPATHCDTLQHPATWRAGLQRNRLEQTATHCNTLPQHAATRCNTLQHTGEASWHTVDSRRLFLVSCESMRSVGDSRRGWRGWRLACRLSGAVVSCESMKSVDDSRSGWRGWRLACRPSGACELQVIESSMVFVPLCLEIKTQSRDHNIASTSALARLAI